MRIDELEKHLGNLLETDFQVRASQEKVIILNNMLAACRNILSLENICNSETLNDGYKVFMTSNMNNFSSSFVMMALQRLAELNIGGNGMANFSYPNMNPYQSAPVMPMQPMPQPVFQQPASFQMPQPQPQFSQMPQPQPQFVQPPQPPVSPQPAYQQPPVQQAPPQPPQPAPQAPEAPQPAAAPEPPKPAPAAPPTPAPAAPAAAAQEEAEEEESSLDEAYTPASGGSSGPSFDMGLPGIGGGNDGPADGRDYLLSILSKK